MKNSSFGTVFYDKQYTISPTKFSFTLCTKIMIKFYSKGIDKQAFIWYTCKAFYFTAKKDVEKMFEKNLEIGFLLDFYGEVLSERKRTVLDFYYNDDLSLAEIAVEIGISRQGVRELIKKAEEELFFLEEKLHLHERTLKIAKASEKLLALPLSSEAREAVQNLIEAAEIIPH